MGTSKEESKKKVKKRKTKTLDSPFAGIPPLDIIMERKETHKSGLGARSLIN
jgi:hypothetical protein